MGRGRTKSSEARGLGHWRRAWSGASVKRSRSTTCSGAVGGSVLRAKRLRSRVKRSSSVKGGAIKATACSRGEAVEGTLCRRQHAPSVGDVEECSVSGRGGGAGIEDLKHASGKNLLSVERAAHAPDINIGGQMRDARSVRRVAHFFRRVTHHF
jgi:hypothetical protein